MPLKNLLSKQIQVDPKNRLYWCRYNIPAVVPQLIILLIMIERLGLDLSGICLVTHRLKV
ncbi:hypothetical protein DSUL_60012 [Desulfovibrionales bacterium]